MRAEPGRGYERLVELIIGAKIAAALHVVVDKGLADVLARGPQTAEALAQACRCRCSATEDPLRASATWALLPTQPQGLRPRCLLSLLARWCHPCPIVSPLPRSCGRNILSPQLQRTAHPG